MNAVLLASISIAGLTSLLAALIAVLDKIVNNYGELIIDINDGQRELSVVGGSSMLSTLAEKKIFIPSACGGKGNCGACKVKVESEIGLHLPTELPWLSPTEIKENVHLACQLKIKTPIKITIPEELFFTKKFSCVVEELEDLTYDIKRVYLNILDGESITFKAGQYAQIVIPPYQWKSIEKTVGPQRASSLKKLAQEHNERFGNNKKDDFPAYLHKGEVHNSETFQRAYSMSLPPSDHSHIEMMVRLVPGGKASTFVHTLLKKGDKVEIVGPFGDFYVRDTNATMVCVAGGSGMAPIKSLLFDLMEKGNNQREIWYFFGARTRRDLFYSEKLKELEKRLPHFHYIEALSAPSPEDEWTGESGLITEVLDRYIKTKISHDKPMEGYLCGSPGMLNACVEVMKQNAIREEDIFFDSFT